MGVMKWKVEENGSEEMDELSCSWIVDAGTGWVMGYPGDG